MPMPTLDQLVADPAAAIGLPPSALSALQTRAAAVLLAIGAALVASSQDDASQPAEVRLLTVDEAAARLGVTPEWLYRRGKGLGLAAKLGDGTLRFSNIALEAYIRGQTISAAPVRRRKGIINRDLTG
jgi:hypothetical protein